MFHSLPFLRSLDCSTILPVFIMLSLTTHGADMDVMPHRLRKKSQRLCKKLVHTCWIMFCSFVWDRKILQRIHFQRYYPSLVFIRSHTMTPYLIRILLIFDISGGRACVERLGSGLIIVTVQLVSQQALASGVFYSAWLGRASFV